MKISKGFTLIEVVLAIAVGLIIIAGVSVGYTYVNRAASTETTITTPPAPNPLPIPYPITKPVPPVLTSGIEGTITIGPTCPVERVPPDPNCADKPYQATVVVKTADEQKELTSFSSDQDGRFKVKLIPGTYILVPVSNNTHPQASSQKVIVKANNFTQVTISFDSGIR